MAATCPSGPSGRKPRLRPWGLRRILVTVSALPATGIVVIQFVPYGRDHQNPPVRLEPIWQSTEAREIAVKACFDCHSNESTWPWYTNVAPIS